MNDGVDDWTGAGGGVRLPILVLVFASFWPFTAFVGENAEFPIIVEKLLLYGAVLGAFVTAIYLILRLKWDRFADAACFAWPVLIFSFFQFSTFTNLLVEIGIERFRYQFPSFLILTGLACFGFYTLAKRPWFRTAVSVTIVLLATMPILSVAVTLSNDKLGLQSYLSGDRGVEVLGDPGGLEFSDIIDLAPPIDIPILASAAGTPPNVYFLMPDAFTSVKTLASEFGFDHSDFLEALEQREFVTSEPGFSNYPESETSLTSTFFMEYLFLPKEAEPIADFFPFTERIVGGENRVVKMFYGRGYDYIHVYNGFLRWSDCGPYVTRCIRRASPFAFDETDNTLLRSTPIPTLMLGLFGLSSWANSMMEISDFVELLPIESEKPFFLFYRIIAPHSPFRFDADCGRVFEGERITKELYLGQLRCVSSQLVSAIDVIRLSDPSAIIIVQSDHGFMTLRQLSSSPKQWTEGENLLAFSNFSAFLLPRQCRNQVYTGLSPVNTFRVVFGCIDGEQYSLLPDVSYLSTWPFDRSSEREIFPWEPPAE